MFQASIHDMRSKCNCYQVNNSQAKSEKSYGYLVFKSYTSPHCTTSPNTHPLDRAVGHTSLPLSLDIRLQVILRSEVLINIRSDHVSREAGTQEIQNVSLDKVDKDDISNGGCGSLLQVGDTLEVVGHTVMGDRGVRSIVAVGAKVVLSGVTAMHVSRWLL